MKWCANCGAENPAGLKFCEQCAAPFKKRCARCGFENSPVARFCGQCAGALTGNAQAASARAPLPQPIAPEIRVTPEQPDTAAMIGGAIARFAEAMRATLPRGRAGGLARARTAWRYFDGTFMPESEKGAAYLEEYERYAIGGRTRASHARRNPDGTFA